MSGPGRFLGSLPGRLESPGQVKRRMLFVSLIATLALVGAVAVAEYGPDRGPFTGTQLRDMSGLPQPPVRFVRDADGTYRELTAEEVEQLQQLEDLIRNFPGQQNFGDAMRQDPDPDPAPDADE